jgi:hypothetical protein
MALIEDLKNVNLGYGKVDSAVVSTWFQDGVSTLRGAGYRMTSFRDFLRLWIASQEPLEGQATLLSEGLILNTGGRAGVLVKQSPLVMTAENKSSLSLYNALEYVNVAKQGERCDLANTRFVWKPTQDYASLGNFFAAPDSGIELEKFMRNRGIEEVLFDLRENTPRVDSTCPVGQLSISAYREGKGRKVIITSHCLPPRNEMYDRRKPDITQSSFRFRGIRDAA